MKKMLSAMCVATVFTVTVGVSAQYGSADKSQADKKGMMKDGQMTDGQMTVSGCVSAGKESGHYMLTNAMMMGGGMMDKDKMKDPGMAGGHMMSYELVGGDLKAHMGHKVEVTGTMSKMDKDKMGKMGKMDKDMDKKSEMDMKAMKLNVTSVKMVSASCS